MAPDLDVGRHAQVADEEPVVSGDVLDEEAVAAYEESRPILDTMMETIELDG